MKINYIAMQGFRCYKDFTRYEFDMLNEIFGGNYQGKSSIMEAITMLLSGCDKDGVSGGSSRLVTRGENSMVLTGEIEVNGRVYEIERQVIFQKNKTVTNILINRIAATQSQIDEIIGNSKHFLAAFLPGYYCGLDPKDARTELTTLIPLPSQEEILVALAEDEPEAASALAGARILDASIYVKGEKDQVNELESEIKRLEGQEEEIRSTLAEELPDVIELDTTELDSVLQAIQSIEEIKPILDDTSQHESRREVLLREYQLLQDGLKYEENIVVCEKCGHENNLNAEQDAKNAAIVEKMGFVKEQGEQIAVKLKKIKQSNAEKVEQFKQTNAETLAELKTQAELLKSNLKATEQHNMRVKLMQDNQGRARERAAKVSEDIQNVKQLIERAKTRIKAGQLYGAKQCELQIRNVEKHLKHVSIQLFDVVKSTGEIKGVFRLRFDDKEHRVLSTSEKIRCDLEIAGLIRALTKRDYPVFIDNAESITEYERPNVQTFVARVVEGESGIVIQKGELQHV